MYKNSNVTKCLNRIVSVQKDKKVTHKKLEQQHQPKASHLKHNAILLS